MLKSTEAPPSLRVPSVWPKVLGIWLSVAVCLGGLFLSRISNHRIAMDYGPTLDALRRVQLLIAEKAVALAQISAIGERSDRASGLLPEREDTLVQALRLLNHFVDGTDEHLGRIFMEDPSLRILIGNLQKEADVLSKSLSSLTESRQASRHIGSLKALGSHLEELISLTQKHIENRQSTFRLASLIAGLGAALVGIFSGLLILHHERQRRNDLASLQSAHEQAQRKERWLYTTLESMGDGVIITDAAGAVLYLNPVATAMTGYSREQAAGRDLTAVFEIANEYTGETVANPIARVLREKRVVGLANHTVLIHRNGSRLPIDDSGAPILDTNGELLGAVLVFSDMTERKRQERAIISANRALSSLLVCHRILAQEKIPEVLFRRICSALVESGACRLVWIAEVLKFDDGVISLKPVAWGGFNGHFPEHIDYPSGLRSPALEAAALNRPVRSSEFDGDEAFEPWMNANLRSTLGEALALPIPDVPAERLILCVHQHAELEISVEERRRLQQLAEDIGFRLRLLYLQDQLATNEQRLRAIFDAAYDGFLVTNGQGQRKIIDTNPATSRIFGYAREELIGENARLLHFSERFEEFGQLVYRGITQNNHWQGQWTCRHKDGHGLRLEISGAPFIASEKDEEWFIFIFRDISEREKILSNLREAKEEAERARAAKEEFLAIMSHEIRTPMNAICGFSELLHHADNARQRDEYIGYIQDNGQHLLHLIDDILDFTKISSGRMDIHPENCRLKPFIASVLKTVADKAARKQIDLNTSWTDELPACVMVDAPRLRQILVNLLDNAIKFTPPRGTITLLANVRPWFEDKATWRLEFAVRDTGIGIHPQDQERIFKVFEQADTSITRQYEGVGLGLAICRSLVEALGGTIQLESAPGEGTTFSFHVKAMGPTQEELTPGPKSWKNPSSPPVEPLFSLSQAGSERCEYLRIVCAEDNAANRAVLEAQLKRLSLRLDFVENGKELLNTLRQKPYDVVLLDVQMPVIGGLEAAALIRKGEAGETCRKIYLIGFSAHASEEHRQAALQAGMNDYLTKPLRIEELSAALSRVRRESAIKPF